MSTPNGSAKPEDNALYRHFDEKGRLLYVGITNDPGRRWEQHKDKNWWIHVRTTTIERYPDRRSVRDAERAAIESEKPWWNTAMNPEMAERRSMIRDAAEVITSYWDEQHINPWYLDGLKDSVRTAYETTFERAFKEVRRAMELDEPYPAIEPEYDRSSVEHIWAFVAIHAAMFVRLVCEKRGITMDEAMIQVDESRKS